MTKSGGIITVDFAAVCGASDCNIIEHEMSDFAMRVPGVVVRDRGCQHTNSFGPYYLWDQHVMEFAFGRELFSENRCDDKARKILGGRMVHCEPAYGYGFPRGRYLYFAKDVASAIRGEGTCSVCGKLIRGSGMAITWRRVSMHKWCWDRYVEQEAAKMRTSYEFEAKHRLADKLEASMSLSRMIHDLKKVLENQ